MDGIFLLGEKERYLFTRVRFGALAGTGQYAYVPLSRRMLRRLQNAGDANAGRRERYLGRRGVVHAAVEGVGEAQRITGQAEAPLA